MTPATSPHTAPARRQSVSLSDAFNEAARLIVRSKGPSYLYFSRLGLFTQKTPAKSARATLIGRYSPTVNLLYVLDDMRESGCFGEGE